MSWEDDIAKARQEIRDAELSKQRVLVADQEREEWRKAALRPQVETVLRVRAALERISWRGAFRATAGLRKPELSIDMPIREIEWMAGESGRMPQVASITYYNRPSGRIQCLARVSTGGGHERDDVLVDDVYFSGERIDQVTPALIQRAAARWSVEHSIELPLS